MPPLIAKRAAEHISAKIIHRKTTQYGRCNFIVRRNASGEMQVLSEPFKEMPSELQQIIDEMK